jgi:hypothetical protein
MGSVNKKCHKKFLATEGTEETRMGRRRSPSAMAWRFAREWDCQRSGTADRNLIELEEWAKGGCFMGPMSRVWTLILEAVSWLRSPGRRWDLDWALGEPGSKSPRLWVRRTAQSRSFPLCPRKTLVCSFSDFFLMTGGVPRMKGCAREAKTNLHKMD